MRSEKKNIEKVWTYLQGDMSDEQCRRFEEEMKVNPSLAACYEEACDIIRSLKKSNVTELRRQLALIASQYGRETGHNRGTFFVRPWAAAAMAAAATLCLCLVLYFMTGLRNGRPTTGLTGHEQFMGYDTLRQLADEGDDNTVYYRGDNMGNATGARLQPPGETVAILNEENPMLEKRVSLTHFNGDLEIIAPKIGTSFNGDDDILFEWKTSKWKHFSLQVLNNRCQTVFERDTYITRVRLTTPLSPGIYYWRLRTEKEMLFSGKFFVR
jgi:hypothetical protein